MALDDGQLNDNLRGWVLRGYSATQSAMWNETFSALVGCSLVLFRVALCALVALVAIVSVFALDQGYFRELLITVFGGLVVICASSFSAWSYRIVWTVIAVPLLVGAALVDPPWQGLLLNAGVGIGLAVIVEWRIKVLVVKLEIAKREAKSLAENAQSTAEASDPRRSHGQVD